MLNRSGLKKEKKKDLPREYYNAVSHRRGWLEQKRSALISPGGL